MTGTLSGPGSPVWVPPAPGTPVAGSVPPPPARRQAPPPRPRRSGRDVVVGLAAVVALLALVVGTPLLLSLAIGWPLPHSLPDRAQITQPVTSDVLLKAVAVVVWIAWAQLTACVIVEAGAGLRGRGLPRRVPLASPHQALAHKLVAAALLLVTAGSAVLAVTGGAGSPARQADPQSGRPGIAVTAVVHAGAQAGSPVARAVSDAVDADVHASSGGVVGAGIEARAATPHKDALKVAVVSPPDGAHHDSLWEIAERHLGDGRRYSEIVKLNEGRPQPDGTSLGAASLIRPGWKLLMPADATGLPLADTTSTHAGHTPEPAHAPARTPARTPEPAAPAAQAPAAQAAAAQAPAAQAPTVQAAAAQAPTVQAPAAQAPAVQAPAAQAPAAQAPVAEAPAAQAPVAEAPAQAPVLDQGWHQPTEDAAPGGAQTWRAPAVTTGITGVRLPGPAPALPLSRAPRPRWQPPRRRRWTTAGDRSGRWRCCRRRC